MLQDGLWLLADRHWRAAGDGRTCGGSDAAGGRVSWWPGEPGWGSEITFLYHFGSSKRVPSLPGSCHFLEFVLCNEAGFEPGVVRGEGL